MRIPTATFLVSLSKSITCMETQLWIARTIFKYDSREGRMGKKVGWMNGWRLEMNVDSLSSQ